MRLITLLFTTCLVVACGDDTVPKSDLSVDTTIIVDGATTTEDGTTEDSSTKDSSTVEDLPFVD